MYKPFSISTLSLSPFFSEERFRDKNWTHVLKRFFKGLCGDTEVLFKRKKQMPSDSTDDNDPLFLIIDRSNSITEPSLL